MGVFFACLLPDIHYVSTHMWKMTYNVESHTAKKCLDTITTAFGRCYGSSYRSWDIEISSSPFSCSERSSRIFCRFFPDVSPVSFYGPSKTDLSMFLANQWDSQKAFSASQSLVFPGLVKPYYLLSYSAWTYSTAEPTLFIGVFYIFGYCET